MPQVPNVFAAATRTFVFASLRDVANGATASFRAVAGVLFSASFPRASAASRRTCQSLYFRALTIPFTSWFFLRFLMFGLVSIFLAIFLNILGLITCASGDYLPCLVLFVFVRVW